MNLSSWIWTCTFAFKFTTHAFKFSTRNSQLLTCNSCFTISRFTIGYDCRQVRVPPFTSDGFERNIESGLHLLNHLFEELNPWGSTRQLTAFSLRFAPLIGKLFIRILLHHPKILVLTECYVFLFLLTSPDRKVRLTFLFFVTSDVNINFLETPYFAAIFHGFIPDSISMIVLYFSVAILVI